MGLWKRKLDCEAIYKNYHNEFLEDSLHKENVHFYHLYQAIKKDYLDRIDGNEIHIKDEKARLKQRKGDFDRGTGNHNMYLAVALFTTIANGFIVAYSTLEPKYKWIAVMAMSVFFFTYSVYILKKNARNDWIFGLCLHILDDIEQEMKTKKKNESKANSTMYNGCWWINSGKEPILGSEDRGNQKVDVGVWVRFAKELRRLIGN